MTAPSAPRLAASFAALLLAGLASCSLVYDPDQLAPLGADAASAGDGGDVLGDAAQPSNDAGRPDAGPAQEADAGPATPDAGPADGATPEPDGGEPAPDGGPPPPDAGEPDGGEPVPDGGPPPPDAGEPDGGEPGPDAASPGDTGVPPCPADGGALKDAFCSVALPGVVGAGGVSAIFATSEDDVWAVGFADMGAAAWHRSGPNGWELRKDESRSNFEYFGVWGLGGPTSQGGEFWVVANSLQGSLLVLCTQSGCALDHEEPEENAVYTGVWGTTGHLLVSGKLNDGPFLVEVDLAQHTYTTTTTLACSGPFSSAAGLATGQRALGTQTGICLKAAGPWTSVSCGEKAISGVAMASATKGWAVGESGIWTFTPSSSAADCTQSSTVTGLLAVFAVSEDDAWAVGKGGLVMRYLGGTWEDYSAPGDYDLTGVWADGSSVWAVGTTHTFMPVLLRLER